MFGVGRTYTPELVSESYKKTKGIKRAGKPMNPKVKVLQVFMGF